MAKASMSGSCCIHHVYKYEYLWYLLVAYRSSGRLYHITNLQHFNWSTVEGHLLCLPSLVD